MKLKLFPFHDGDLEVSIGSTVVIDETYTTDAPYTASVLFIGTKYLTLSNKQRFFMDGRSVRPLQARIYSSLPNLKAYKEKLGLSRAIIHNLTHSSTVKTISLSDLQHIARKLKVKYV